MAIPSRVPRKFFSTASAIDAAAFPAAATKVRPRGTDGRCWARMRSGSAAATAAWKLSIRRSRIGAPSLYRTVLDTKIAPAVALNQGGCRGENDPRHDPGPRPGAVHPLLRRRLRPRDVEPPGLPRVFARLSAQSRERFRA